jgi:hypothetical protein
MTATQAKASTRTDAPQGTLRAIRATATVSVLVLVAQFVTAGQMLMHIRSFKEFHSAGAIVLHVVAGLAVIAAVAHWWRGRSGASPVVLAGAVFVFSFVQAYLGDDETMWLHVPGALVLTVGAVWLMTWSFVARAKDSSDAR